MNLIFRYSYLLIIITDSSPCKHFTMSRLSNLRKAITRKKFVTTDLHTTPLARCLSTTDLSFVGIGSMLGSGVYVLTGEVAGEMAGPAAIISFAIAGENNVYLNRVFVTIFEIGWMYSTFFPLSLCLKVTCQYL